MGEILTGLVTGCRTNNKGTFVDILGFDGTYYTEVETFLTPGMNEVPVPATIPIRDPNKLDITTGSVSLNSAADVLNAPANSYVMYTTAGPYVNSIQQIIPIRFFKNYAQASASPPKYQIKPQPGEVAVQAAGTSTIPGGYAYFDRNGNSIFSSAGRCSLSFTEKNGLAELLATRGMVSMPPFTIKIDSGELSIVRQKYAGPGTVSPVNDVKITVTALGDIEIEQTPTGVIAQNKITLTVAGGVQIESKSQVTVDAPSVNLNSGDLGAARETDPVKSDKDYDPKFWLWFSTAMSAIRDAADPASLLAALKISAATAPTSVSGVILSGSKTVRAGG
jgi:hypothetical protein